MYNLQSMDAIVKDSVIAFQYDFDLVVSCQRWVRERDKQEMVTLFPINSVLVEMSQLSPFQVKETEKFVSVFLNLYDPESKPRGTSPFW